VFVGRHKARLILGAQRGEDLWRRHLGLAHDAARSSM
jgi:hypothetical protein